MCARRGRLFSLSVASGPPRAFPPLSLSQAPPSLFLLPSFLGLLPCDPDSVGPDYLPPAPRSRATSDAGKPLVRIDLRRSSVPALRSAAAASAPLPQPKAPAPPVPSHRLGLPTGSAPKRRRRNRGGGGGAGGGGAVGGGDDDGREGSPAAGAKRGGGGSARPRVPGGAAAAAAAAGGPSIGRAPDADARLAEFLGGGGAPDPPWEALGVAKPPVIGGSPLDLRLLWTLVSANGGYEETVATKRWARVAQDMGHDCRVITNAGWLVRHHYLRFLMPHEVELRRAGRFPGAAATVGGNVGGGAEAKHA